MDETSIPPPAVAVQKQLRGQLYGSFPLVITKYKKFYDHLEACSISCGRATGEEIGRQFSALPKHRFIVSDKEPPEDVLKLCGEPAIVIGDIEEFCKLDSESLQQRLLALWEQALHKKMREKLNADGIPEELRSLKRFVVWRLQLEGTSPKKIPYDAQEIDQIGFRRDKCKADVTDEDCMFTFEQVIGVWKTRSDVTGIGFCFVEEDGYFGIDLDHCITDGKIKREAQEILTEFCTYRELSISGDGIHLIGRGVPLKTGKRPGKTDSEKWIEVYNKERYFVMTGIPLSDKLFGNL